MNTNLEIIIDLKDMLSRIANTCDHAMDRDGVGFSKSTALIGHMINAIDPEYISDEMEESLKSILYTHRNQLPDPSLVKDFNVCCRKDIIRPYLFMHKDTHKYRFWTPVREEACLNIARYMSMGYIGINQLPISEGYLISLDNYELVELLISELYRGTNLCDISIGHDQNMIKVNNKDYNVAPQINLSLSEESFTKIILNKMALPISNKAVFRAVFKSSANFKYDKLQFSFASPNGVNIDSVIESSNPTSENTIVVERGKLVINEVNYFGDNIKPITADDMNSIARTHCNLTTASIEIDFDYIDKLVTDHNSKFDALKKEFNRIDIVDSTAHIYFMIDQQILNLVRSFSNRTFKTTPTAHWQAKITNTFFSKDLGILNQLVSKYGFSCSDTEFTNLTKIVTGDCKADITTPHSK